LVKLYFLPTLHFLLMLICIFVNLCGLQAKKSFERERNRKRRKKVRESVCAKGTEKDGLRKMQRDKKKKREVKIHREKERKKVEKGKESDRDKEKKETQGEGE
jgi:hypothetical protein